MKATVIVPLLAQRDEYLTKCLTSAAEQSASTEVVVVESAQTPESNREVIRRLIEKYPAMKLIQRPRSGIAAGLNAGIQAASTTRVGFLMSDDWLEPRAVETCLDHGADIVSTSMTIYDESGAHALHSRRKAQAQYDQLATDDERAGYLGHFLLFRRAALLNAGGVDESIGHVGPDDFDLVWTMLERGASVKIVEDGLYCLRDHRGTRLTLRPVREMRRDFALILDKHGMTGARREKMMEDHSRWFGRTLQEVIARPSQRTRGLPGAKRSSRGPGPWRPDGQMGK